MDQKNNLNNSQNMESSNTVVDVEQTKNTSNQVEISSPNMEGTNYEPSNIGPSNVETPTPMGQPNVVNQPTPSSSFPVKTFKWVFLFVAITIIVIGVIIAVVPNVTQSKKSTSSTTVTKSITTSTGVKSPLKETFSLDQPILVKKNNLYGYINKKGEVLVQPQYLKASEFYGKYASVTTKKNELNSYDEYLMIDSLGNVVKTVDISNGGKVEHIADNRWILKDKLYDNDLKQITTDNVKIVSSWDHYAAFEQNGKYGILNMDGEATYVYQGKEKISELVTKNLDTVTNELKDRYCIVQIRVDDLYKQGIVNCATGKVIYDYTEKKIIGEDNNIFRIEDEDQSFEKRFYIQDDEIKNEITKKEDTIGYLPGSMVISTKDEESAYGKKLTYIDIETGKKQEKYEKKILVPEVLQNQNYTITSCENTFATYYGIQKDGKDILSCEWSDFSFFEEPYFESISKQGKNYIIATKSSTTSIIDLTTNQVIKEAPDFHTEYGSGPFIQFTNGGVKEVYNVDTGKSIQIPSSGAVAFYSNCVYIVIDHKASYYDENFNLIYEGDIPY